MDTEYVVTILLRAREYISNAFNRAAGSVDKLRQSEEQLNKTGEENARTSRRQGDALEHLTEAHVREKVATDSSREALEQRLRASQAAEAGYRDEAQQLEELSRAHIRQVGAVDDVSRSYDRQARDRNRLANEQRRVSSVIEEDIDRNRSWERSLRDVGDGADHTDLRLNRLNASLQGFQIAFVIKYAQALVSAMVALAGSLLSVASAAAVAGATLAGTLVAGIAQALPVVGVLAAGLWRIVSVMKAVTLHNQQALTATHDHTAAQERQRNAANQVTAAQERVAEAHRKVQEAEEGVTTAQRNLTDARREARRELEDLIEAEIRAKREAESANLSFEAAQRRLRDAVRQGDVVGAAEARIDVGAARQQRRESRTNVGRASADAARGTARGVEGSDRVLGAERQLIDARRRVADANRDVKKSEQALSEARHDAAVAMNKETASADRLQAMLALMSPAERRLYQSVIRLQNTFRERVRPITDVLVNAFARGIDRGERLLRDNRLMGAFRGLAQSMAKASDDIGRELMNSDWRHFFTMMTREASHNVPVITRILMALARVFRNIAEAAAPAFRLLLRMMEGYADRAERATKNSHKLEDFFKSGVKYVRSFIELGIAAIKLFAALAGAGGAEEGKKSIDGVTASLRRATKWVDGHRAEVRKFFADARAGTGEVLRVLLALAKEMIHAFNPGTIKAFADFLVHVVIPALGNTIKIMGFLTSVFHQFLSLPIVRDVAQYAATILLLTKSFMILRSAVGAIIGLARAFLAFNPYVAIFIALATAVVMLDRKFHFLKPTLEWLKRAWTNTFNALKGPVLAIVNWVKKHWEGLVIVLTGPIGLATVFIIKHFNQIKDAVVAIVDFVIDAFRGGGSTLGKIFRVFTVPIRIAISGIVAAFKVFIRIFQGVVEVVTHLVRGEWGKAWRAARNMVVDVVRTIGRLIGRVAGIIWGGLKDAIGLARKGMSLLLRILTFPIRTAIRIIGTVISRLPGIIAGAFEKVFNFMKSLPAKLFNFAKDAAVGIVKGFANLGADILKAIAHGAGAVAGFGKDIVNGIIELLNRALPNSIELPSPLPNVDLPNNPFPKLAVGGKVNAPMFLAGEEAPGHPEFVFSTNPRDRSRMIPLLLELLQIYGIRGFQEGGKRGGGGGARGDVSGLAAPGVPSPGEVKETMDAINKIVKDSSGDLTSTWRRTWRRMLKILDDSNDDQRRNLRASLRRMNSDADDGFARMQRIATKRADRLVSGVQDSLRTLMRSTYTGMSYVGDATNSALKSFDVKPVHLSVPRPKGLTRAVGGVVGEWGERGKDMVNTWLGRGEVVLNWAQQQALNAKIRGQDTVQSIVSRTHGYHAGGPEAALGYATGGIVPIPGMPGESIYAKLVPAVRFLINKFKVLITDGYAAHGHAANSDHHWGGAVDMVPGRGGSWDIIDKLAKLAEPVQNMVRAPLRWVGYNGDPNHGRGDHLHFSWQRGGPFDLPEAIKQGAVLGGDIPKIRVDGPEGNLRNLAQKAINKVRDAAQQYVDEQMPDLSGLPGAAFSGGSTDVARAIIRAWKTSGRTGGWKGILSAFETALVESGMRNLHYGDLDSLGTFQQRSSWGSAASRLNPFESALRFFARWHDAGSPGQSAQAVQVSAFPDRYDAAESSARGWLRRMGVPGFRAGGEVPGPLGKAVDAVIHAGEWVLNPDQQERLSHMLGVTKDRAKELLGLASRSGAFQAGGVVSAATVGYGPHGFRGIAGQRARYGPPWPVDMEEIFDEISGNLRHFRRDMRRKGGKLSDKIRKTFSELTRDGGLLDQVNTQLEAMQASATAAIQRLQFHIRRNGRAIRRDVNPVQVARREERYLHEQRSVLRREAQLIHRGEQEAHAAMRRAHRLSGEERKKAEQAARAAINNLEARARTNSQALAQNAQDIVEKHEAVQSALSDRINNSAEQQINALDTQERVAKAFGRALDPNRIAQRRLKVLERQQHRISEVLREAQASGNTELANTLKTQMRDLKGQIAELAGQMFQNSIDTVNETAQRELGLNDVAARMAEIGTTNFAAKQRALVGRGGILTRQRAGLADLLGQAQRSGNIDQVRTLTQSLAELDATIAENSQAVKDNTNAAFQRQVEDINTAFGFTQTISQAASSFFTALGSLTGSTDQGALLGLARGQTGALQAQRTGLAGLLANLLGYNPQEREGLMGMSGADLVNYILSITTGPALESILSRLDETQKGQFRDLTGALITNAQALVDNTTSINELTGQVAPQAFTSSAWQMFRQAIYNGMGGLLPQYTPPQLHQGALVTKGGVFELAAGEAVLDPVVTQSMLRGGDVQEGDTTIIVHKGEHLDEGQLATRWSWERSRRPKGT